MRPLYAGEVRTAAEILVDGAAPGEALTLEVVYHGWYHEVSRWVRALGGLDAEVADLAQEVFIVVGRKLPTFRGENLAGWLYGITARTVRDARRRAWFRHLVRGRAAAPLEELPTADPGPDEVLDEREGQRRLQVLLARLSEKRRSVFVLFEIEGYSGEEIAGLQGIPVATVWTRLYHARRDLARLIAAARRKEQK